MDSGQSSRHRTMGQARREAGIPESEYLRQGDSIERIATIRCLARLLSAPDHRYEGIGFCRLDWTVDRDPHLTVCVTPTGAITN